MRSSKRSRKQFDFELGDGVIARRETGFLADGTYFFEDDLEVKGFLTSKIIIGTSWLLEVHDMRDGEFFFIRNDVKVRPQTKHFGILFSPFSISQPCFRDFKGHVIGFAAKTTLPPEFATVPVLFDTDVRKQPQSSKEAVAILRSATNLQPVELNSRPSLLPLRAKRLIDENYLVYPSIARIAARLGVSHAHLSREFKRNFRMSPSAYLHQQRLADASQRLVKGEKIVDISQDVGYNDLSRFYKQFRKQTKTSPGVCRTMIKPR